MPLIKTRAGAAGGYGAGLLIALLLAAQPQTGYAQGAGEVEFTRGVGYAQSPGQGARILGKGLAFREGDTLSTSEGSTAIIRMQDGEIIADEPVTPAPGASPSICTTMPTSRSTHACRTSARAR